MATTESAAAKYVRNRVALAALASIIASSLAGCGTSSNLLGPDSTIAQGNNSSAQQQKPVQVAKRIAIPDVIGAPEAISRQMVQQLSTKMQNPGLAIAASPADKPDYTLRGYMVAAQERKGTKVSYIWNLTDQAGNKLKQITGEEIAPKIKSSDPWAAVTPAMIEKISDRTSPTVVAALPVQPSMGNLQAPQSTGTPIANIPVTSNQPSPTTTTGSIANSDEVSVVIVPVTGASGDGNIALTRAMKTALANNGVIVAPRNPQAAYRMEGKVQKVGEPDEKGQPVKLIWSLTAPDGRFAGGIEQDNTIDMATWNGKWGTMANEAADAAAQSLVEFLPKRPAQKAN